MSRRKLNPTAKTGSKITGAVRSRDNYSLHIQNDVGGSSFLPPGTYRVQLVRSVYDDETGVRCTGRLLTEEDIAIARRVGTTGRTPEDYRKCGKKQHEETLQAARDFDPSMVYFFGSDFVPDTRQKGTYLPPSEVTHNGSSPHERRQLCFNCAKHAPVPDKGRCRYCILADEALEDFWSVIVRHFPEAKFGDLSPEQTIALHEEASSAICEWISNNIEQEG